MSPKSAFLSGPRQLELRETETPELRGDLVLVRLRAAGICGSDLECYTGKSKEGRYDLGPYVPGHEWAGEVAETGPGVSHLRKGDKVTGDCVLPCGGCENCKSNLSAAACLNMREAGFMPNSPGGMGEYLVMEERFLHQLPEEMSFEEGALVEPFSVSYYAIWGRGGYVNASDEVVVFGAGPIGLFAAVVARAAGARVILVEPIGFRRRMALDLGIDEAIDPRAVEVKEAVAELTKGRGADLVVEASGTDQAIASLGEVAAHEGRIRLIGHSIGRKVSLELGLFIWKSLSLTGQAGSPFAFPRTIRFMSRIRDRIDYTKVITDRFPLERIQEAFDHALKEKERAVKVMVVM